MPLMNVLHDDFFKLIFRFIESKNISGVYENDRMVKGISVNQCESI
jgi:hypothetical protein